MDREEGRAWMHSTWDYAKMILPYLSDGVLVAGAPMYFATLTEVPILQGLIGAGMRKPRSGVVFHSGGVRGAEEVPLGSPLGGGIRSGERDQGLASGGRTKA